MGDGVETAVAHRFGSGLRETASTAAAGAVPAAALSIHVDACEFTMGNDGPDAIPGDGEGPARRVWLSAFSISPTCVTNREFGDFVRATRYITDAERAGSSFVFHLQAAGELRRQSRRVASGLPWWLEVENASWQRPEGPGSHIHSRLEHPVVHVSWNDASAYCEWMGARLPTEAEWECAARGGVDGSRYAWGDELMQDGVPRCNVWRGAFPSEPAEGWLPATVPVNANEPNRFGLYNVCGNVWEWCSDWFSPAYHEETAARDPTFGHPTGRKSMRGGSYLCHDSYCNRYRVAARSSNTPESASGNLGFRVASSDTSQRQARARCLTDRR